DHQEQWAIFEFRAEGTGYPDSAVYDRIHHFPWPDHHPPPFSIVPNLMAAMRNWLTPVSETTETQKRVAVVHCKAGKGRSGTVSCSYLISEQGWSREDALKRFTKRRMRSGFGEGVSIPSQLRWVRYVDRWTNSMNKQYLERPVEIVEIHIWGLRGGVKVCVEGFVDEGRRIKNFHTFTREEKVNVDSTFEHELSDQTKPIKQDTETLLEPGEGQFPPRSERLPDVEKEPQQNVILRPRQPIRLEASDVNIDFERRNTSKFPGFTMVTSIAHVWFNTFFEGGYEGNDSGVFEIEWAAMDGIKGSERKGIKALDKLKVVWRYPADTREARIEEPKPGEPVAEGKSTDWRGGHDPEKEIEAKHSDGVSSGRAGGTALTLKEMSHEASQLLLGKDLGLRKSDPHSAGVSRASSVADSDTKPPEDKKDVKEMHQAANDDGEGVQTHGLNDSDDHVNGRVAHESHDHDRQDTAVGRNLEAGLNMVANMMSRLSGGSKS
ncbi:Telomerase protein component 1, partial [Elasticomyces elasticus]